MLRGGHPSLPSHQQQRKWKWTLLYDSNVVVCTPIFGGSEKHGHWALCVLYRADGLAVLYDSFGNKQVPPSLAEWLGAQAAHDSVCTVRDHPDVPGTAQWSAGA